MAGPVLVAIDDNPDLLRDVERELRDRYERHYRVICVGSDVGITSRTSPTPEKTSP